MLARLGDEREVIDPWGTWAGRRVTTAAGLRVSQRKR